MQGNNELALKNTQPTVKDGANEELLKRMRALEEVVKQEREKSKREDQKKLTLENRAKYHDAIAAICAKYDGLDSEVVSRLSLEDKEHLADLIEGKVKKSRALQQLCTCSQTLIVAGAFGSLGYFVHGAFFLFFWAVPVWLGGSLAYTFFDYRAQTVRADRIALQDEAKPDAT